MLPSNQEYLACVQQTQAHIDLVRDALAAVCAELRRRGTLHDASKLASPEFSVFAAMTPKLAGCTYGSEEYRTFLADMQPALAHHYAANRHHPEHHAHGVGDMTLIDLVEMFCDWLAATKRHNDGNIYRSIEINRARFGLSDQLAQILLNTAELLEPRIHDADPPVDALPARPSPDQ